MTVRPPLVELAAPAGALVQALESTGFSMPGLTRGGKNPPLSDQIPQGGPMVLD
jgi:hypothetical protein